MTASGRAEGRRGEMEIEGSCEREARIMKCAGCDARVVPEDDGYCPTCRDEIDALSNPELRISFAEVLRESFTRLVQGESSGGVIDEARRARAAKK